MAKAQLDMCADIVNNSLLFADDHSFDIGADLNGRGLAWTIINPCGPGGGCPIIEVSGDYDDVLSYLANVHYSQDDVEWVITQITK